MNHSTRVRTHNGGEVVGGVDSQPFVEPSVVFSNIEEEAIDFAAALACLFGAVALVAATVGYFYG